MNKYEITNISIEINNNTLYRIRALKDFEDIKAGDLGGYVENESNLSQEDNCWVDDNARVSGSAIVYGSARVYDNAIVYGNARVRSNAIIKNSKDHMCIGVLGSRDDYTTFYLDKDRNIWVVCGCFYNTIEKFEKVVKKGIKALNTNRSILTLLTLQKSILRFGKRGKGMDKEQD